MKLATTLLLPFCALLAAAPAQDKKPQEPKKPAKIEDSKFTRNDPAIRAIDKLVKKANKKQKGWKLRLKAPAQQEFQKNMDYFWHVETSEGPMKIRYFVDEAPMHCTSGIFLARLGFYDGIVFHRIIPQFMAQGGDPLGRGNGGPGYFMDGEFQSGRKHDRPGLLSMANTGRPRSDGSQFFLTFVKTPWLDGKHTIWGEIVEGMDTLKKLEKLGTRSGRPTRTPKIVRTWVEVVPKKGGQPAGDKDGGDKHGTDKHGTDKHGADKHGAGKHGGK